MLRKPTYQELEARVRKLTGELRQVRESRNADDASRRLVESERRLNEAQRVARIGSFDRDLVTGEVQVSEEMYRIWGYDPPENRPLEVLIREHLHPGDKEKFDRARRDALAGRGPTDLIYRIITVEGEVRTLHTISHIERDPAGIPKRFYGTTQDITELRQIQYLLARNEYRFNQIMNRAPAVVYIKDLDGRFTFVNERFAELFGKNPAWYVGKSDFDLFPWETAESLVRHDRRVLRVRAPMEVEEVVPVDGRTRTYISVKFPVFEETGEVRELCGISTEITARKRSEEVLRESEAYYRSLFDESPTALCLQDFSKAEARVQALEADGVTDLARYLGDHPEEVDRLARSVVITHANQALLDLYGAQASDDLRLRIDRFLLKEERQHFIDQMVALTSGQPWYEGEAKNRDLAGNVLHIILRKTLIHRHKRDFSEVLVSITDVTALYNAHRERERLESHLVQVQKMEAIGTLAGGIAHDFNNILGIIMGNTELATLSAPRDGRLRSHLNTIQVACLRARDVVQQLLSFSRKTAVEKRPVKILPIIRESASLLRASIPSSIRLRLDLPPDIDPILADPTQIHQILINLCTNAAHAMEDQGGVLEVSLKAVFLDEYDVTRHAGLSPGPYVRLSVSDTGHGIPEAIRNRIFDPYFSTKAIGKGAGMGLSVVHGIVTAHGGSISLYSEPGKGSRFHILFPSVAVSRDDAPVRANEQPTGSEHILFVDDERELAVMTGTMLGRLGYRATVKTDPLEALDAFRSAPESFDLVITDMTMPHMTGDGLAKELLRIRAEIPVILCTGFSEKIARRDLEAIGIRKYLEKPIDMGTLARGIREALEKE